MSPVVELEPPICEFCGDYILGDDGKGEAILRRLPAEGEHGADIHEFLIDDPPIGRVDFTDEIASVCDLYTRSLAVSSPDAAPRPSRAPRTPPSRISAWRSSHSRHSTGGPSTR